MESEIYCLGLKTLGECSYNPADPKAYFTLGNLLSVIALLLAISQLTRPIIKFRIRSHNFSYKTLVTLLAIAISSVFLATILPFIPGTALPVIGYPVFWELLSASLFVGAGIYVIWAITKPAKFSPKNAEEYLNATVSFIAKGGKERLNDLAEEIYPSISDVIEKANKFDRCRARAAKERNEVYEVSKITKIANTILRVWSDRLFCEAIVCRSPDSAIQIIADLGKASNSGVGHALSNEIINQSFENNSSILNREEQYSGLGFFKSFTRQCFSDWRFVEGTYRPLESWTHYRNTLTDWKVVKYCECTNIAFKAYLESRDYWQHPSSLYGALDTMTSIAMNQTLNINHIPDKGIDGSENQKILVEISRGFQDLIKTVLEVSDYPEYDFDDENYDHSQDPSIFGVVANGIYEYFGMLARAKGHDEFIRNYAISIWQDIFGARSSEFSKNQNEIGKRLLFHIEKKINENLDHEQRWYPAITKLLLSLTGIFEAENSNASLDAKFHALFLKMIKGKFPLLYKTDQEFALNMLPESITYDEENNKLVHNQFRGKTTELCLNKVGN